MTAVLLETSVLLENQELPRDQDPGDGVASADLQTISESADGMNDTERYQETLRVIAETQRALVAGREGSGRHKLAQIRSEEDSGVDTATQYQLWRRSVLLHKCFRGHSYSELTLLSSWVKSRPLQRMLWTSLRSTTLWDFVD